MLLKQSIGVIYLQQLFFTTSIVFEANAREFPLYKNGFESFKDSSKRMVFSLFDFGINFWSLARSVSMSHNVRRLEEGAVLKG